jgi:hypothetical protein
VNRILDILAIFASKDVVTSMTGNLPAVRPNEESTKSGWGISRENYAEHMDVEGKTFAVHVKFGLLGVEDMRPLV